MAFNHRGHEKFLGRTFNHNTMMWEFRDGSGVPLPEELRMQMRIDASAPTGGAIVALLRKWAYEEGTDLEAQIKDFAGRIVSLPARSIPVPTRAKIEPID